MFSIFTISPIILLLFSSYLFNRKKLKQSLSYTIMISTFEAILSYFIVYLIFFEGFFSAVYQLFIFVILLAIIAYVLFFVERDLDSDLDLQVETIKNNLVLFFITVAPFYLFLTVFRFQGVFLQILYSFLVALVILFVYFFFRKRIDQLMESLVYFVFDTTERALTIFGGGLLFIFVFALMFNVSTNDIKQQLNLTDNVSYLSFNDLPQNLDNNFKHKTKFKITLDQGIDAEFADYYVYEGMLYLYSEFNTLYTIDIESESIIHRQFLSGIYWSNPIKDEEIKQLFFEQDNQLYLLTPSTLYQVSPESYTMINLIDMENLSVFYDNDQPHLLGLTDTGIYQIHRIVNNEVVLVESVDLASSEMYDELVVIDDTLFYQNEDIYTEYYDDEYSFARISESSIYDAENHIMYATFYDEIEVKTIYYQSKSVTSIEEYELSKMGNLIGFSFDGLIYFVEPPEEGIGRVEIMNKDFDFQGIHNHLDYQKFWMGNQFTNSRIINYAKIDDELTYLQLDTKFDESLLTFHVIEERPTGIDAPFYSHHGLWMMFPIVLALFIPLSDYRKHITFIGFSESVKKK